MPPPALRCLAVGAALGLALSAAPARAQLVVEPGALAVMLEQGEEAVRTVALTNAGDEAVAFCLSFNRPLQRDEAVVRLSESAMGGVCGPLGEVLLYLDQEGYIAQGGVAWDPFGLTMIPDGRLFAADTNDPRTHELTAELEVVRSFEHPFVDELDTFPTTQGVTYNADTGTLWWLNVEKRRFEVLRALLLEGDLDGVPTGRRIELPVAATAPPPFETGEPVGPSYDPATRRYYFVDGLNHTIWAVDTLGTVIPGYPTVQTAYPDALITFSLDAHGGASGEPEAVRLELGTALAEEDEFSRIVVVDRFGEGVGIETPLPDVSGGSGFGSIEGNPLRSRTDPNGVLYFPFVNFDTDGIVGIRPHPLPPSWLAVSAWAGTLAPGEETQVTLTFRPGRRSVGEYTATLQAFEAATGAALEVPLTLTVTQGTDAEGEGMEPEEARLAVYPNPSVGAATVTLTLPGAADVAVVVYDVLGRRVATLADGRMEAGTHRLPLDGSRLPSGVYLVRAELSGEVITQRITILR